MVEIVRLTESSRLRAEQALAELARFGYLKFVGNWISKVRSYRLTAEGMDLLIRKQII